jgi:TonB family protein
MPYFAYLARLRKKIAKADCLQENLGMTSPRWAPTNRESKCQSAIAFTIFSASLFHFVFLPRLEATPPTARKSDAELSQALIGTWESSVGKKYLPIKKAFTTFESGGIFKDIAIIDISGAEGRIEIEGKWHIKNGVLIEQITKSLPKARGEVTKDQIVSIDNDIFVSRTEDGDQEESHRGRIPSHLPPLLFPHWMSKFILAKPQPEYPVEARNQWLQGKGLFTLIITKTGKVSSVEVAKSTGHTILDNAAIKAFKMWRFAPNSPMEKTSIPIEFVLRKSSAIENMKKSGKDTYITIER